MTRRCMDRSQPPSFMNLREETRWGKRCAGAALRGEEAAVAARRKPFNQRCSNRGRGVPPPPSQPLPLGAISHRYSVRSAHRVTSVSGENPPKNPAPSPRARYPGRSAPPEVSIPMTRRDWGAGAVSVPPFPPGPSPPSSGAVHTGRVAIRLLLPRRCPVRPDPGLSHSGIAMAI